MAVPDMIGFVVRDMPKALRFYRLLGLDIASSADSDSHVEWITPGGFRLAWDRRDVVLSFNPEWVEPVGHRSSLAFKCETPAEVDALYARVVAGGFRGRKAPWDAFWGQRYALVEDPDGNMVDLFARL